MGMTVVDTEKELTEFYPLPEPYVWKIKGAYHVDDGDYPVGYLMTLGIAKPVQFLVPWYPYARMTLVVQVNAGKGFTEFKEAGRQVYYHPSSWVKPLKAPDALN